MAPNSQSTFLTSVLFTHSFIHSFIIPSIISELCFSYTQFITGTFALCVSVSGKFMYAVRPINSGTNTTLLSPRQRRPMCFIQFFYHMGSRFLNDLIVSVRKSDVTYTVFKVHGFQGNDWQKALIDVHNQTKSGEYEVRVIEKSFGCCILNQGSKFIS